ncbi:MAG: NADH-quinone oxidoreductase subunit J [Chloroflexi bacterium]|nr:NADH-quinone oxidoreductase subunit J [Chloroflexota bacterium]
MSDPTFGPLLAACVLAFVSALLVVISRGSIRAVVALLAHSLSIAALYAILAAGLVAAGQLLIYSGAIVVLFLFVVVLLPPGGRELAQQPRRLAYSIGMGVVLLAALMLAVGPALSGTLPPASASATLGGVPGIGHELFDMNRLLVPFELTAPLLLVAIIGSVALWRRQGSAT